MRRLLFVVFVVFLAGCRGTQPYSATDLSQVRLADATIEPIYLQFRRDYFADNSSRILADFGKEQQACRQVDVIDKRDTIDPNVNLFQASADLDDFCNAIESAYVWWAKKHGYHYDKSIVPGRRQEVFLGSDLDLKTIRKDLRNPAGIS